MFFFFGEGWDIVEAINGNIDFFYDDPRWIDLPLGAVNTMLAAVAAKVACTKLGFPSLAKPILTLAKVRLPTSTVSHPKTTHVLGPFSRSYNPNHDLT
jgi:hypothetical protein